MQTTAPRTQIAIVFGAVAALWAVASVAQPEGGPRRGPPPKEAVDACADAAEGDACSFSGRNDDTVKGTCRLPPAKDAGGDAPLVCVPEGHGGPRGGERGGR